MSGCPHATRPTIALSAAPALLTVTIALPVPSGGRLDPMSESSTSTPDQAAAAQNAPGPLGSGFSLAPFERVTERVFVAVAQPASVNIGLVVGDDHVLLIDTGSSPDQGREIAAAAAQLAGRPVDRVVITHGHYDHFFGLAGVDAEVSIGHSSLTDVLSDPDVSSLTGQLGFDRSELVAVNTAINVVKALDLGGTRAEVVHFGKGHTGGDLVVILPDDQVIFTGDLLEVGADPCFTDESTVETWPAALDGAVGSATERTVFVPGHGARVGREEVFMARADISTIYGQAEQLVARGVRLEQALEALDAPVDPDGAPHPGASEWEWPFTPATIKQALPLAYAELAGHGQSPRTQLNMVTLN